jgi:hypothetical protein
VAPIGLKEIDLYLQNVLRKSLLGLFVSNLVEKIAFNFNLQGLYSKHFIIFIAYKYSVFLPGKLFKPSSRVFM